MFEECPKVHGQRGELLRVIILEDHPIVLEALENRILQIFPRAEIIYAGKDLDDALTLAQEARLIIVDLDLGDGRSPVDVVKALAPSKASILVMSALADSRVVNSVMTVGANGYFTKTASLDQLEEAISCILSGQTYISPQIARASGEERIIKLSAREQLTLKLYADGLTIEEVAKQMGVAPSTANEYLDRVKIKFRTIGVTARTKVDLHKLAVEYGLI